MSEATVTEVTKQSWGSRLGRAFKGILFGFILIGIAIWLLFSNEGRAVRRARALTEGAGVVVSVPADRFDPAHEGKLVHLSGQTETFDTLRDPAFGVTVNAIHLERSVEMYQWRERTESSTEKKLGGSTETTTTYSYVEDWSSSVLDSRNFKRPAGHENPGSMPYQGFKTSARDVSIGAFRLSPGLIRAMTQFEPLPAVTVDDLPGDLRWKARLHDGGIYIGRSPSSPEIGDLRVAFKVVHPALVSVVARQTGGALGPYQTTKGESIELLSYGAVPADAMFQGAQKANRLNTWILRLLGFLIMTFGLKRLFRPLSVMADVVPAIGRMVEASTGLVAYLLAAFLSLIVVAVAWLYYRPVLAVTLLVLAGAVMVLSGLAIARALKRGKQPTAAT